MFLETRSARKEQSTPTVCLLKVQLTPAAAPIIVGLSQSLGQGESLRPGLKPHLIRRISLVRTDAQAATLPHRRRAGAAATPVLKSKLSSVCDVSFVARGRSRCGDSFRLRLNVSMVGSLHERWSSGRVALWLI